MTEFISRNCGKEGYEIIIKTDSHEHYRATEDFARRLIGHAKPMTNADKIRDMSDEELNEMFHEIYNAGAEDAIAYGWGQRANSFEWTLDWLKQPSEVDHAQE